MEWSEGGLCLVAKRLVYYRKGPAEPVKNRGETDVIEVYLIYYKESCLSELLCILKCVFQMLLWVCSLKTEDSTFHFGK